AVQASDNGGGQTQAPAVLRTLEPRETRYILLPGAPSPKAAAAETKPAARILAPAGWRPEGGPTLQAGPERRFPAEVPAPGMGALFTITPEAATAEMKEFQPIGPPPLPSEALLAADPLSESAEESIPEVKTEPGIATLEPRKPTLPAGFSQESAVF